MGGTKIEASHLVDENSSLWVLDLEHSDLYGQGWGWGA
jgi:hypothetical protein